MLNIEQIISKVINGNLNAKIMALNNYTFEMLIIINVHIR